MLHLPILVAGIFRGVGRGVANRIGRCAMVSFQGRYTISGATSREKRAEENGVPLDFLLPTLGSAGDVIPVVCLGRGLVQRGHSATVVANEEFEIGRASCRERV